MAQVSPRSTARSNARAAFCAPPSATKAFLNSNSNRMRCFDLPAGLPDCPGFHCVAGLPETPGLNLVSRLVVLFGFLGMA